MGKAIDGEVYGLELTAAMGGVKHEKVEITGTIDPQKWGVLKKALQDLQLQFPNLKVSSKPIP